MTKTITEHNTTAFVLSIMTLVSCILFWFVIPTILLAFGWFNYKKLTEHQSATKIILIIASIWIGFKIITIPLILMMFLI